MKSRIEDKSKIGIYAIINTKNGKKYIGKSINIHRRIKNHIGFLNQKSSKHENEYLINAWNKYGREQFDYLILEECTIEKLSEKELYYIEFYNTTNSEFGYNFRKDSSTGMVCSDKTRAKMKNSHANRNARFPHLKNESSIRFKKFWAENPDIKKSMVEQVSNKIRKYKIAMLNYETQEIIEIFDTRASINEKYPKFYTQAILGCCSGNKKSYKGFKWCYLDKNTNQKI